jgi:hypothetical protein
MNQTSTSTSGQIPEQCKQCLWAIVRRLFNDIRVDNKRDLNLIMEILNKLGYKCKVVGCISSTSYEGVDVKYNDGVMFVYERRKAGEDECLILNYLCLPPGGKAIVRTRFYSYYENERGCHNEMVTTLEYVNVGNEIKGTEMLEDKDWEECPTPSKRDND